MYEFRSNQLEFLLPFGGHLDKSNRWVCLAKLVPWDVAELGYAASFKGARGPRALSARIALGTLIIKERLGLTDRETVEQIRENPYLQYFLGFREYVQQIPFDASMLVLFRSRLGMDIMQKVNDALIASQMDRVADHKDIQNAEGSDNNHDNAESESTATAAPCCSSSRGNSDYRCDLRSRRCHVSNGFEVSESCTRNYRTSDRCVV